MVSDIARLIVILFLATLFGFGGFVVFWDSIL